MPPLPTTPPRPATGQLVRVALRQLYPGVDLFVSELPDRWRLDCLVVEDPAARGRGLGTAVLRTLLAWADEAGVRVSLTPEPMGGVPVTARTRARLTRWYRTFGFMPNKGRRRDFTISESMIREPALVVAADARPPGPAPATRTRDGRQGEAPPRRRGTAGLR